MESDLCVPKRTTKRPKAPRFSGKRSPSREGVGTKTSASPQARPRVSQKEPRGAAQRRTLQVFRGNGLVTKGARQGSEEGSSRNARALHSALSAWVSSCGQPRWLQGVCALCRIHLARRGWPASPETVIARTQEKRSLVRGSRFRCGRGLRRSMVVPVRRICLQKSVSGDGPMKRLPNVNRGRPLTGT